MDSLAARQDGMADWRPWREGNAVEPTWKSAIRQVWKPALRKIGRAALNRYDADGGDRVRLRAASAVAGLWRDKSAR